MSIDLDMTEQQIRDYIDRRLAEMMAEELRADFEEEERLILFGDPSAPPLSGKVIRVRLHPDGD